jgi:hypothetical protein
MGRLMWRGLMIHQKQLRTSATRKYCLVWIEFLQRIKFRFFLLFPCLCNAVLSVLGALPCWEWRFVIMIALFSFARNPLISSSLLILVGSPVKLQTSHNLMSPNFGHARNWSHSSLHQWFLSPSIFTASSVCVCVCVSLSLSLSHFWMPEQRPS